MITTRVTSLRDFQSGVWRKISTIWVDCVAWLLHHNRLILMFMVNKRLIEMKTQMRERYTKLRVRCCFHIFQILLFLFNLILRPENTFLPVPFRLIVPFSGQHILEGLGLNQRLSLLSRKLSPLPLKFLIWDHVAPAFFDRQICVILSFLRSVVESFLELR
jgi:hypothetical protein